MRVLITGANGFVGSHVVAALRRADLAVRALVGPGRGHEELDWDDGVEVVRVELLSDDLTGVFDDVDAVIHLAAKMLGDDDERIAVTVGATERLLEAMARSTCRRIVLAGSFSVYDYSRIRRTIHEDSPIHDADSIVRMDGYARAKWQQEQLVRRWCDEHDGKLTVLRPAAIWGNGMMPMAMMGQSAGPLTGLFAPLAAMKMIYVENCAEMFARAVQRDACIDQTINLVDDDRVTVWRAYADHRARTGGGRALPCPYWLGHFAAKCASALHRYVLMGKGPLPSILHARRFEARFKPVAADNDRQKRLLGWESPIPYERALQRAYPRATNDTSDANPGGDTERRTS